MGSICGVNCEKCERRVGCKGCVETFGSPFGGKCICAKKIMSCGNADYIKYKAKVAERFNDLNIEGMPKISTMYEMIGSYVNLEYCTPGGIKQKFLNDNDIYLANQVKEIGPDGKPTGKCFGVVANDELMIVARYREGGEKPELIKYIEIDED